MDQDAPRIVGDFKLKRELGRGGMGVVYLARQISLGRDVALKVLPADDGFDDARVLRFQREAAMLGRVSHPNIVKIFTVGEQPPYHYLAMEYVEGTDLERVLAAKSGSRSDDLPEEFRSEFPRTCVEKMRDVAVALGVAHKSGIVHRDVKPSNILIEKGGRCVLADFGLARDVAAAALTRSQHAVGTPYYMSPERFGPAEPEATSDVYAVGAVLYQCLTGVRPFDATTPQELMQKILRDEPVPPRRIDPSISKDLQTIVLTCLEKDPASRYPSGVELASDLDRMLRDEPIAASAASPITQAYRRMRRRQTSLFALLAMFAAAAAFMTWGFFERRAKDIQDARSRVFDQLDGDHTGEALEQLDSLLAAHSDLEELLFERAELLMRLNHWQEAATRFDELAARGGEFGGAAALGAQVARGIAAKGAGLEQIDMSAPSKNGREAFYRGFVYQTRRDYVNAERETLRATELPPQPLEAWYSLGGIRFRMRDYEGAEVALLHYKAKRTRAEADMYLGQIENAKTNYDAARGYLSQFVARHPESVLGWNNLASAHLALAASYDQNNWMEQGEKSRDEARKAIAKAKEIDAEYFLVAYNEAVLLVQEGAVEAGESRFQRAIDGCNNDPYWKVPMWWHFARQLDWAKQSDRAVECMERAKQHVADYQSDFSFIYAYAGILESAGRREDALGLIDAALAGPLAGRKELVAKRSQIMSPR